MEVRGLYYWSTGTTDNTTVERRDYEDVEEEEGKRENSIVPPLRWLCPYPLLQLLSRLEKDGVHTTERVTEDRRVCSVSERESGERGEH